MAITDGITQQNVQRNPPGTLPRHDPVNGYGTLSADLRVRRMCKGIDSLWPALWTYLDVPGVEPTNNGAERAIRPAVLPACRPAVLWRTGSFGTQSGSGARFAGAMLTVAATCRMHGLDLFAYLAGVCTASMAGLAVPQLLPAPA